MNRSIKYVEKLLNTKQAEEVEELFLQPTPRMNVSNDPAKNIPETLLIGTQAEEKEPMARRDASNTPTTNTSEIISGEFAIPPEIGYDLQALEEKVISMMERSSNTIRAGTQRNGKRKQTKAVICKVCGKEGLSHHIKDHIEVYHLEGISIPCHNCEKSFSKRHNLRSHKTRCAK